jgi:hypothetical protein
MALDKSQTKVMLFTSQGLPEAPKSSKNTSQKQHVQRNREKRFKLIIKENSL